MDRPGTTPRLTARAAVRRLVAAVLGLGLHGPAMALLPAFDLPPGAELRVVLPAGSLEIRPRAGGQVAVDGLLSPGQRLRRVEAPGRVVLRLDDPDRPTPAPTALRLEVPPEAALRLRVGDASLDARGVGLGGLHVDGGAGRIRIDALAGRVRVATLAGAVEVRGAATAIEVDSLSAPIDVVAGGEGVSLHLSSLSGAIRAAADAPGPVVVDTVGGDVELRLGQGRAPVAASTLSGDVRLRLPEGAAALLSIAPGRQPLRTAAGARVDASGGMRIGPGEAGWPIRLATVSGRLSVQAGTVFFTEPSPNVE